MRVSLREASASLRRGKAALVLFLIATPVFSQSPGLEFFEKKIRPVLAAKCYSCHGGALKEPLAALRLDTAAGLRNPKLLAAIEYSNLDLKMPPTGKLPAEVIADFRQWAAQGSPAPADRAVPTASSSAPSGIDSEKARQYWAFQPVRKAAPPTTQDTAWPRRTIDRFLLARLEAAQLKPAAEAEKRIWLRRVTYDLIGLPPTGAELEAFLNDRSPTAHETVVDRLLRSPHYRERWARHWLDLMRFAETNGHEYDNTKLDAWQYRDYVIRAFNEDLPYDRFVREQIAGDLIPQPRLSEDGAHWESPIGTNFYWFGEVLNSATDSVKSRADQVDNQIDVLSKTFLGLTVSCARCHDHKFDPIPTVDYYALASIMHSTAMIETIVDSPRRRAEIENAASILTPVTPRRVDPREPRAGDDLFETFSVSAADYGNWIVVGRAFGDKPTRPGIANSAYTGSLTTVGSLTSPKFKMPKRWVQVRLRGTKPEKTKEDAGVRVTIVNADLKSAHFIPTGKPGWEWRSARMTLEFERTCQIEIVDRDPNGYIAVDEIVISDNDKPPAGDEPGEEPWTLSPMKVPGSLWAMVARDENPGNVKLHIRGSHRNPGAEVIRGFLRLLPHESPAVNPAQSGRLELAQWVASASNPLTARVMVNRIWKHHFGQGLVRTLDNFGKTGERPSHPELLDWLAAMFVESGWSVKELHREIVLSSAYRMASKPEAKPALDPRNDLLSCMPMRRLEGEAIRDAMLAISGRLMPEPYGPSVAPHISKYQDGRGKPKPGPLDGGGRRSLYVQVRRNFLTPLFLAFDYPLPISTIGARGVSTVPSQALLMTNNELVAELASAWGRNLMTSGLSPEPSIRLMYREAFARDPEPWEVQEASRISRRAGHRRGLTSRTYSSIPRSLSMFRSSRRDFLCRAANGFGGLAMLNLLHAAERKQPHFAPKAKSVIFLFMDSGPSQMDTFDPKPRLVQDNGKPLPFHPPTTVFNISDKIVGSPFSFKQHGQSGAWVSELFPHVAGCVDDMAIIRSMVADHSEHTAANYFIHSGSDFQGRPSMGAWVNYGLGSASDNLPGFVVLESGLVPPGGMDCFGSGFLPASYQGTLFRQGTHPIADFTPATDEQRDAQIGKLALLRKLNAGAVQRFGQVSEIEATIANYELAYRMQSAVPDLLDLSKESEATKKMYGIGADPTDEFGRECLLARRLVERGVRFVELLTPARKGLDRWDQHSSLEKGHRLNAQSTDPPIAALLKDLKTTGLLKDTLVIWGGEFGRTPCAQFSEGAEVATYGRDHNPFGFTMWMAGGGVKGGQVIGATDEFGYFAIENKVHMHDLHATMLHLLGLDHK